MAEQVMAVRPSSSLPLVYGLDYGLLIVSLSLSLSLFPLDDSSTLFHHRSHSSSISPAGNSPVLAAFVTWGTDRECSHALHPDASFVVLQFPVNRARSIQFDQL